MTGNLLDTVEFLRGLCEAAYYKFAIVFLLLLFLSVMFTTELYMGHFASEISQKDETIQWVKFSLSGESYGIRVLKVQEIQRYSEISPIPGAPSYVLGIINLRGTVISVLNTRERFGLGEQAVTDDSRIVILEASNQIVGILVDSVAEVISIKASEVDVTPNIGNDETARFIDGVTNKDGELLILLDAEKILNEEEWKDLSNL